jgi:AraC family transcriptional regulator
MANSNVHDWLGEAVSRKAVGPFIFVQHLYPRLSERHHHTHPWLHLSIVQRGLYARSLGTRITQYRAGTMALLATDESHADSYAPGTKCLHMVIPSHLEARLARDFACRERAPLAPLHPINVECSVVLYREFKQPDSHSPFVIEAVLLDMMSRELGLATERSRLRPPWIRTILQYLDETYDQPWSLTDVARDVGVHPVYLCRAFSEHLGMTLGQYVRQLRVLLGWQLLSIGNDGKIADIANESGFADESHFSREFRKAYGISPGRYSRIIKG